MNLPILANTNAAASTTLVQNHFQLLATIVKEQMTKGIDYGEIPGTKKNTLLKPGADKLCRLFGLYPVFTVVSSVEDFDNPEFPQFHYRYRCELIRFEDGRKVGEAIGSCNSYEKKYRWRKADRTCPKCGAAAILKSKDKDEFFCWRKKDGCGATFPGNDPSIVNQPDGQAPNPDIFDIINTIDKMAQKRSYIGSVILAVNASEFFTQDLEDLYQGVVGDVVSKIKETMKEIGWSGEKAKMYLTQKYPTRYKGKINDLTEVQLQEFLIYLHGLRADIDTTTIDV